MKRSRADLALAGNTLIWGVTFVVVKRALADVSPLLFLALRFLVATAALAVLLRGCWSHPRRRGVSLRAGLIAGVFLFGGYVFQTAGLRLTSAPKSAFITGLAVVMVPVLGAFVYRVRPRLMEVAGVLCAAAGLALLTLQGEVLRIGRGDMLTLICAAAFAAHIITVGHYSPVVSFELLSLVQVATSAALSLATFWWVEPAMIRWSASVWVAIGITGLLATALAFTVQAWAQQYTTSTRTALIYALEPVFAWLTSFVVTGETLSARGAAGAALILVGILAVELGPGKNRPATA